jgi:hypothetical protein
VCDTRARAREAARRRFAESRCWRGLLRWATGVHGSEALSTSRVVLEPAKESSNRADTSLFMESGASSSKTRRGSLPHCSKLYQSSMQMAFA